METEDVKVTVKDRVCWITLNRPEKLNSITVAMHKKIRETLDAQDDEVKCVIIKGEGGRAFSAGADITEIEKLNPEEAIEYSREGHKTILKILTYSKPVVALIEGYALGGGLELALACDFRLATNKSRFSFPETGLGLIPGWGGSVLLSKLMGPSKAKELLMTGNRIDSVTAMNYRIVHRIVSDDTMMEEVKAYIKPLTDGASQPMHEIKKQLLDLDYIKKKLDEESKAFGNLFKTDDYKEGLAAFKEKRKPSFK